MKLLFPTPVVYDGNDERFLRRDGGRFVPPLVAIGGTGIKVVFPAEDSALRPKSRHLAIGSEAQWRVRAFWESFNADGAVCYFGLSARRFLPVVRAMRDAGLRLVLKTDSSFGLNEFPNLAGTWARKCYWIARESHSVMLAAPKAACDFGKWMLGVNARTIIPYFEAFDVLAVESPLALKNTRKWLLRHGREDIAGRVTFIPHPVPDDFTFDPTLHCKENLLLAIAADWRNPLKGGKILARAISRFLTSHPDWKAVVVGGHSAAIAAAIGKPGLATAITVTSPETLLPLYRSAKVFVTASGSESGPIVAFEAFACECTVVFPPELRQLHWMVDAGRGVMAASRSPSALAAAIDNAISAVHNDASIRPLPPLHASKILTALFPPSQ